MMKRTNRNPIKIRKIPGKNKWRVYDNETDKIYAFETTKEKAHKQRQAIIAKASGWSRKKAEARKKYGRSSLAVDPGKRGRGIRRNPVPVYTVQFFDGAQPIGYVDGIKSLEDSIGVSTSHLKKPYLKKAIIAHGGIPIAEMNKSGNIKVYHQSFSGKKR